MLGDDGRERLGHAVAAVRRDDRPAFRGVLLDELEPKPEFAPVISTVSAAAADGTASAPPMSSAAPSASAERLSIAIPPAVWLRSMVPVGRSCGAAGDAAVGLAGASCRGVRPSVRSRRPRSTAARQRQRSGERRGRRGAGASVPERRRERAAATSPTMLAAEAEQARRRRTSATGTPRAAARRRSPAAASAELSAARAGRRARQQRGRCGRERRHEAARLPAYNAATIAATSAAKAPSRMAEQGDRERHGLHSSMRATHSRRSRGREAPFRGRVRRFLLVGRGAGRYSAPRSHGARAAMTQAHVPTDWHPASWQSRHAAQQPAYRDRAHLDGVLAQLEQAAADRDDLGDREPEVAARARRSAARRSCCKAATAPRASTSARPTTSCRSSRSCCRCRS